MKLGDVGHLIIYIGFIFITIYTVESFETRLFPSCCQPTFKGNFQAGVSCD